MNRIRTYGLAWVGIGAGALLGYVYYHFVGCSGGSCPITSNPLTSTFYGAVLGGLFIYTFKKDSTNAS